MKKACITGCILSLVSTSALADLNHQRGWFVGAGLASTSYDSDDEVKESGSSITAYGGFRFNKYLALQGNFFDLGKYDGTTDDINFVEMNGASFTANGLLPISSTGLEFYGRLGLAMLSYTQNIRLFSSDFENSTTGDAIVSAIGLGYTPKSFQRMSFKLEFSNYYFETSSVLLSEPSQSHSVNNLGATVQVNF